MTAEKKDQIMNLRKQGMKYSKIGTLLSMSENTIKSFCRRSGYFINDMDNSPGDKVHCKDCGIELVKNSIGKTKKFCSESCRRKWWKQHKSELRKLAFYEMICAACGKKFKSYGNKNRKYCGHECYIFNRFEGGIIDDRPTV